MAILRKDNKEQFTVVPQGIVRDKRLSLKDIGLLISMLSLPDNWEFSENGLEVIFEHDGQASIRTGLKKLEACGYLKRERVRGSDGRMKAVNWYLSEYPVFGKPQVDKPHLENPNVVNPSWEKPNLENPPQSNTKQSNTKEVSTKESNTHKKSATALASDDAVDLESEFENLWKLYPRKEGKSSAQKDYIKARKDKKAPVTFDEVKQGIERYTAYITAQKTERRFIKQGSTWFHQRCWEDEYLTEGRGSSHGEDAGSIPENRVGNYI